jgi:hypothetical protein
MSNTHRFKCPEPDHNEITKASKNNGMRTYLKAKRSYASLSGMASARWVNE